MVGGVSNDNGCLGSTAFSPFNLTTASCSSDMDCYFPLCAKWAPSGFSDEFHNVM